MKKTLLASSVVVALSMLTGCGGGGDSGSTSSATTGTSESTSSSASLIESGMVNTDTYRKPYTIVGNYGALYNAPGCVVYNMYDKTIFSVFSDASASTSYSLRSNGTRTFNCLVSEAFFTQNLANATINASYIGNGTLYDASSKIFYDVSGYSPPSIMVSIINDGLNGVSDTGDSIRILRAYKKINLSDIGISPKQKPAFFGQGVATDVVEFGRTTSEVNSDVYDFEGSLYLYSISGTTVNLSDHDTYVIYNDGRVVLSGSKNGYLTAVYELLPRSNQSVVNANYVSGSVYGYHTFYDSSTKYYYELDGSALNNHQFSLAVNSVTSDGYVAVFSDGGRAQILKAYKKLM
jgi:hypothetical protein